MYSETFTLAVSRELQDPLWNVNYVFILVHLKLDHVLDLLICINLKVLPTYT